MGQLMIDAELLDDLNRFADLSASLDAALRLRSGPIGRAGKFRRAFLMLQHADQIRDAGEVARYQAREMVRD